MKSFNPTSNIYLTDVPWTDTYTDCLTFNSENEQRNYFNSIIKKTFSNYVYLKKDSAIKVEGNIDDLITFNYLFYENPSTNKRYYCFITNMEYISENTTQIYFETDVWQTWGFNLNYKKCFVERCHVADDSVGANTVPEGLETGEYITPYTYIIKDAFVDDSYYYVLGSTTNPVSLADSVGDIYNGIFSGVRYYATPNYVTIGKWLNSLADNKIDAIVSLFIAPKWIVGDIIKFDDTEPNSGAVKTSLQPSSWGSFSIPSISSINGYTPRNNKLLTYPYCFIELSNNSGGSATFNQELFKNITPSFNHIGALCPGCSTKLYPTNYAGNEEVKANFELGLTGGKYPICNWATDQFTNWLTQNGTNIATSITIDFISMYTGYASGVGSDLNQKHPSVGGGTIGTIGNAINGFSNILNTMRNVENHRMIAPQVGGNVNSGDVCASDQAIHFILKHKTIKTEFAKIIDDFFDMFGYKVNRIQTLSVNGRPNWNYVKTINCNLSGNIPEIDLNKIKSIFDNGCTFWHNINTMFDYSQNNK